MEPISNIGPQEVRKRLGFGIAALSVGAVIAVLLIAAGVSRVWRLALFLPLFLAGLGFFQAQDRT